MLKSIHRQNAADYRSIAESARDESQRSLLLSIASEWDAMADAAARRLRRNSNISALNRVTVNQRAAA
jgi:hypothetical protein